MLSQVPCFSDFQSSLLFTNAVLLLKSKGDVHLGLFCERLNYASFIQPTFTRSKWNLDDFSIDQLFQKDFLVSSFGPKYQRNFLRISALASTKRPNQKNELIL